MNWRYNPTSHRKGAAAVLAMLFLVLMTTLSLAMFTTETTNVQTAHNLSDVGRAQAAAEAGVRWMAYRFEHTITRPKTTKGAIDAATADTLWQGASGLQHAIVADLGTMVTVAEGGSGTTSTSVTSSPISLETNGATFRVTVAQKTGDHRFLTITSTGTFRNATRSVAMEFKIDKKIKYAVVGKVPIQLGRNTIVEGPVAMATPNKFPPLLMLSDFMHFDTTLANTLNTWNTWLQAHHNGFDNRISVNNTLEYAAATAAGYTDYNGDAYIDEYDLFVKRFDTNHDKAISTAEFTKPSTGLLYEANLFKAIDTINGPMFAGDPQRVGYNDGKIDNNDGYAKLRGYIELAVTADAWAANLATQGKDINDMVQGTVAPTEPGDVPVKFGVPAEQMLDLDPANFKDAALNFKNRSGTNAGATVLSGGAKATVKNKLLTPTDNQVMKITSVGSSTFHVNDFVPKAKFDSVNATLSSGHKAVGTNVTQAAATETTPYGSTTWQATYKRPVFKDMVFENVQIPKGLNALFDNCTFKGVTWVEGEGTITTSGGATTYNKDDGMSWAQRKISGDTFSKDKALIGDNQGTASSGQTISEGSKKGNNLRFNNCTIEGPLAGNYSTAYTHFANSWEFTGATMFNNQVDETATIVSPQVNIEMGSFTNPGQAPSTLIGVVVAGNIDIRGTSTVDGSIIITGDGAGNTTLAYFGANDGSTDPNAPMPEGGWGRLNIRYNPTRALPDGINLAIDVLPVVDTYSETVTCAY